MPVPDEIKDGPYKEVATYELSIKTLHAPVQARRDVSLLPEMSVTPASSGDGMPLPLDFASNAILSARSGERAR